ncbi:hypothetical protein BD626DRAFT_268627 [Schizophyllum amplum]|uniref:Uncharacterized protein n=1 Tax=Schizophyllum amplum TaxID=97359 RepID=A0A550BTT7_9AGAR|nr:hypothetical protein BD626DRAFT_268627 [Auriculariopsis ampla]
MLSNGGTCRCHPSKEDELRNARKEGELLCPRKGTPRQSRREAKRRSRREAKRRFRREAKRRSRRGASFGLCEGRWSFAVVEGRGSSLTSSSAEARVDVNVLERGELRLPRRRRSSTPSKEANFDSLEGGELRLPRKGRSFDALGGRCPSPLATQGR